MMDMEDMDGMAGEMDDMDDMGGYGQESQGMVRYDFARKPAQASRYTS